MNSIERTVARILRGSIALIAALVLADGVNVVQAQVADHDYAIIHYLRSDGDYGDHTIGDFNDFWGLHLWGDAIDASEVTDWTSPKPFVGEDEYGRFAWIKSDGAGSLVNFIVHRGDPKDGTDSDRSFDADANPEIWIKQDDGSTYLSQADAQGFVTVYYHRDDGNYGDPSSPDFNDFWGLHLWGDAIDPAEATDWPAPKPFDGVDGFGAYWIIQIVDSSSPVNFIIHRGDTKDPGPDESFVPQETASVWKQSLDVEIYPQECRALEIATIHYHRDDGDYGDPTSPDFNDFWGLHAWTGALNPPTWTDPIRPSGFDTFGSTFDVDLVVGATELAYILHRGDVKDPGPDQFLPFADWGCEVWQVDSADPAMPYVYPLQQSGGNCDPADDPYWDGAVIELNNKKFLSLSAPRGFDFIEFYDTNNLVVGGVFALDGSTSLDVSFDRTDNGSVLLAYNGTGGPLTDVLVEVSPEGAGNSQFYIKLKDLGLDCPIIDIDPVVALDTDLGGDDLLSFALEQNFPNPFRPQTTIVYSIAERTPVTLTVLDLLGREVRQLAVGTKEAGTHEVSFDGQGLPSGVYFYRLLAGEFAKTRRMTLMK
ncbi:MAG: T9SS type A sorting domain-containing protein [Rhodothermales bacterium]|nr:T9SS type A sorting domain-containing protein [Rhodothermales bacterium]